jgi:sodium/proline symporter
MSTTTAILCAFGVYLLLMIGIGVWCMKKTTGADDYFLGGRGLSGPVAALSAQASDMSGWLLMGLPGSIYALGTGQAWIAIGLGLGTIANWLIIAKPLRAYTIVANNSMTLPEFFGNRYHDFVRNLFCDYRCFLLSIHRFCAGIRRKAFQHRIWY